MRVATKQFLILFAAAAIEFLSAADSHAQSRKMIVGQAGVNPGAGLFTIAVNQGFYKKHGLDVEIIKTNTTAAVQAMLAGQNADGHRSGQLRHLSPRPSKGRRRFVLVGSWVNVFPYKIMAQKGIKKVEDLKGKTGHVGAPFGTIPDTALRFALTRLKIDPEQRCQAGAALERRSREHSGGDGKRRSAVRHSRAALRSDRRKTRL